MYIFTIQ